MKPEVIYRVMFAVTVLTLLCGIALGLRSIHKDVAATKVEIEALTNQVADIVVNGKPVDETTEGEAGQPKAVVPQNSQLPKPKGTRQQLPLW